MNIRHFAQLVGLFVTAIVTIASPLPLPFDVVVGTAAGVATVGLVVAVAERL